MNLSKTYIHAQNNSGLTVAAAAVGLGLGVLSKSLAINEIQDYQEAMMLEDLIELGEIYPPLKVRISTLCWNFNSYTDLYRANVMAFYVKTEDKEPHVYLKVIGNRRNQNEYGTVYTKTSILKYDVGTWQKVMLSILRNIDSENSSNYVSEDSILITTSKNSPPKLFNLNSIKYWENRSITFYDNKVSGFDVFHTMPKTYDDDHVLFEINSGLLHQEKLIADYSEKEITIYIPSLKESIMFKIYDILEIKKALDGKVQR